MNKRNGPTNQLIYLLTDRQKRKTKNSEKKRKRERKEERKQGRIHGKIVMDGWAAAASQKTLAVQD